MYKLIKNAGLHENGEKLVHSEVDYTKKADLYKNAKAGLLKYFGGDNQKGDKVTLEAKYSIH